MKRCDDTRQSERGLTSGQPITAARCNRSISGALRLVTGYCRDESIPSVRPESVDHPVPPALPRPRITAVVMTLAMSDELGKTPIVGVSRLVTISGLEINLFQIWTYWLFRLIWNVFHHFCDGFWNSHTNQTKISQFLNPNNNTREHSCTPSRPAAPLTRNYLWVVFATRMIFSYSFFLTYS